GEIDDEDGLVRQLGEDRVEKAVGDGDVDLARHDDRRAVAARARVNRELRLAVTPHISTLTLSLSAGASNVWVRPAIMRCSCHSGPTFLSSTLAAPTSVCVRRLTSGRPIHTSALPLPLT